jgi:hypothetical protein
MNNIGLPSAHTIEVERTANNARILEIIFSFFSIFGTGWLYTGNYLAGIVGLVLSALFVFPIELAIVSSTLGICACLILPINIVLGVLSGNNARAWALTNKRTQGSVLHLIVGLFVVVAINVIVTILLFTLFAGLIGSLSLLDSLNY